VFTTIDCYESPSGSESLRRNCAPCGTCWWCTWLKIQPLGLEILDQGSELPQDPCNKSEITCINRLYSISMQKKLAGDPGNHPWCWQNNPHPFEVYIQYPDDIHTTFALLCVHTMYINSISTLYIDTVYPHCISTPYIIHIIIHYIQFRFRYM
jgi:hypothetical protein